MKIGFLPLYIKLYDDIGASRTLLEEFYIELTKTFEKNGVEVVTSEFCCIKPEFEKAVEKFEKADVDAIVTWHAAYSPSLESIDALVNTNLPIVVLDTTPTPDFTTSDDPGKISWNHGIHGVMDMCSMLKQRGKPYAIAAGYYLEPGYIERILGFVRAAMAAKKLGTMKVGLAGGAFEGMGDFAVDPEELKQRFGICVETVKAEDMQKAKESVTDEEFAAELEINKQMFDFDHNIVEEEYHPFVKSCLALRKCVDNCGYNAFSVNFLDVSAIGTMPFVECCKAMERGIGYAGEGDALTAAFTGAFLSQYPDTSFVEIFCPDWQKDTVFLSHMGEMNYRIADGKPLLSRTGSAFVKGTMPYAAYSKMKAGKGLYVNISRDKDDYSMLIAPCEMLSDGDDTMTNSMRGWMRHESKTTAQFLQDLSVNGATHHSTFVYDATVEQLEYFARLLSLKTVVI